MTSRVFIFVATRSKGLSPLSVLSQRPFSAYLVGVKRNMNERTSEDKTNKSTPQAEAESDLEREHEVEKRRKGRRDLVKKAEQPPQQVSPSLPGTAISVSSPTSAEERAPSLVLMRTRTVARWSFQRHSRRWTLLLLLLLLNYSSHLALPRLARGAPNNLFFWCYGTLPHLPPFPSSSRRRRRSSRSVGEPSSFPV